MDNYALVIDISSDEERESSIIRSSTPVRAIPVNVVTTLDLSTSSLEATRGSANNQPPYADELDLSNILASTFETIGSPRRITFTSPGEVFSVEGQIDSNSESSYYEEPDTPRPPPQLQRAPVFRDVTNSTGMPEEPPNKIDRLDDLTKPNIAEIEDAYGINLDVSMETSPLCGIGTSFTSSKMARLRKQPVLITREIPHCPRPWPTNYRGALSRPAPGRDFSCCGVIPKIARGRGHGSAAHN